MSSYIEFFVARRGERPIEIFCSSRASSIYQVFSAPCDDLKRIKSEDLVAVRDELREELELIEKNLKMLADERTQVINSSNSIDEKREWLKDLRAERKDYEDTKEENERALELINFLNAVLGSLVYARDEYYDLLVGIDVSDETLENYKGQKI